MSRSQVISRLADLIGGIRLPHPVRVGIDGIDAAGKTSLADELAGPLAERGRPVIRVSIDGFHNPRTVRYRRGRGSPRGYYEDSFDLPRILSCVLLPLGPGGDLRYRPAVFDVTADREVEEPRRTAPAHAILLFDGIFLHRGKLRPHWDYSIFLRVDFATAIRRAQSRDLPLQGSAEKVALAYRTRYLPGQRIYLTAEDPMSKADIILDNDDLQAPVIRKRGGRRRG